MSYTLAELCDAADVTPRTVRYYIQQGLLRSPESAGPLTRYDESHLWRLRLVKQLQREHLPLAEIRKRLAALSDEETRGLAAGAPAAVRESAADYIRSVLGSRGIPRGHVAAIAASDAALPAVASLTSAPPPSAAPRASAPLPAPPADQPAAGSPDRSQWDRVALTPDVELHIRRPLSRDHNRRVDRLISIARQLLEEDTP